MFCPLNKEVRSYTGIRTRVARLKKWHPNR